MITPLTCSRALEHTAGSRKKDELSSNFVKDAVSRTRKRLSENDQIGIKRQSLASFGRDSSMVLLVQKVGYRKVASMSQNHAAHTRYLPSFFYAAPVHR